MDIQETILKIFSEVLNIPKSELSMPGKRIEFENWDSLVHLQLVMTLEEKFNIKLKTDEVIEMESIQKCIEIVDHIMNQNNKLL